MFPRPLTFFFPRLYRPFSSSRSNQSSRSQLSSYLTSLRSRYPSADAPSLIASFLILHELTAIVPLLFGFFALKSAGVGDDLVEWVRRNESDGLVVDETLSQGAREHGSWGKGKVGEWIREGEKQAEGVGRRYGLFGFKKETKDERVERKRVEKEGVEIIAVEGVSKARMAGDVANLVVVYLAVKATLPLRLLISARLSPVLANLVVKNFKGLRSIGAKHLKKGKS